MPSFELVPPSRQRRRLRLRSSRGRMSIDRRRSAVMPTLNLFFCVGAPATRFVVAACRRCRIAPRRPVAHHLLRSCSCATRATGLSSNSISRRRATGRPTPFPHRAPTWRRPRSRPTPYIRVEDQSDLVGAGRDDRHSCRRVIRARAQRGDRGEGRQQKLLGAGSSRQCIDARPISTTAACFACAPAGHSGPMKFGIERLLADPALRAPLEGKRVALLAHPASVTADLTHSLDALAACRGHPPHRRLRAAARAEGRQAGQYDRDARRDRSAATASRCSASTARCAARPGR